MSGKRSYLAAAFNARPFGMPIPPNWIGIATFAVLGAFINPGLWLIGVGLEGLYLWALSQHPRFRKTVDAQAPERMNWDSKYQLLLQPLDVTAREQQSAIESQAAEIIDLLTRTGATESQMGDVRQMTWLHLKLLAARAALLQVIGSAVRERRSLETQEVRIETRLQGDCDEELRRSLEQQLSVIRTRRAAHADAERRRELVDAEIDRLRQQVSLVREQALLATDENSAARSLDALSASLNEANRWLKDQRELFAGLDDLTEEAPPPEMLQARVNARSSRRERISE
ncbi:MAG TPA: hypothetical protein VNA21_15220 [Steroidobacteraceae bacterium]|nr:hypothetical protein [Steroidobacteraceae bacterium]